MHPSSKVARAILDRYQREFTYSFQDFDRIEVNSVGLELETPLHMACTRGALEDVEILIAAGANLNAQTGIGTTPLMRAVYVKHLTMVETLLAAGADVSFN